jgi:hypothetical protein
LETANFKVNPWARFTTGEILPNGTIVDLVATANRDGLDLISWDGTNAPIVAPAVDCGGILYQAAEVDPAVRDATRFPSGAVEYGTFGELFRKISCLGRELLGLPEDLATFATCWIFTTWVVELMLIPISLVVSGARLRQNCNLLRFLGSVCRRPLLVGELSRRLPFFLSPTLLVNDPTLSAPKWASWQATNCHGVHVAGGGSLRSLVCSRAVVLRPRDFPEMSNAEAMFLALPPIDSIPLTNETLDTIASEFQPQLQMFRLHQLRRTDQLVVPTHPLARFELARNLGPCVPPDVDIARLLTPLLELHQQDIAAQESRDPRVAILEAVWCPSHDQDEISVGDITKRANTILRARGAEHEYNVREVGWKLRGLHLCTTSNGKRKTLRFLGENRYAIHRGVREFGLQLPFRGNCEDCRRLQATKDEPVG